jgi:branched-chain amino acid transport system permease protein
MVGGVLGLVIEPFLLRRIYAKEQVLQLLVTFAVFMILEDVQRLVWGTQPYYLDKPLTLLGTVDVAGVAYTSYQLLVLPAVAVVTLIGLRLFLRRTLQGKLITAVTHDREAAQACGINARRVYLTTFTIGATLAAFGGALATPTTSIVPGIGTDMIVLSFAVAATAGLGQVEGAAITALLIGLGRSFAVYLFPELDVLMPYLIMVAVLAVRPQGLFGVAETRKV